MATSNKVTLIASDGRLYTPHSAIREQYLKDFYSGDPVCIVRYPEGDCDTIQWPLQTPEDMVNLAHSLYDSREIGVIPHCESVILPNGEEFPIDNYIQ